MREFPLGRTPDGVFNMAGNVWEWTWSYGGSYSESKKVDPLGPHPDDEDAIWRSAAGKGPPVRVIRGSFYGARNQRGLESRGYRLESFQGAFREGRSQVKGDTDVGFRVARWVVEPAQPTWTVRFFESSHDPVDDPVAWRSDGEGQTQLGFENRVGLNMAFGKAGPSQLPGVSTAVRSAALPSDGWGTIAEGVVHLPDDRWAVTVFADDGVRLWADGILLVDAWKVGKPESRTERLRVPASKTVHLRVEHFNRDGPAALSVVVHRW